MNQSEHKGYEYAKAISMGLFVIVLTGCAERWPSRAGEAKVVGKPNFIIIFADDQGYQDVGCFGSPAIKTPCLDQMAREGMRLTSFCSQPVCGPARAALTTGCYPIRVMRSHWQIPRLRGRWKLRTEEITIAEILKEAGYATGCTGKWDLSGRKPIEGMLPNDQGFDYYFGTLGANDGGRVTLWKNKQQLATTDDMGSLTRLYTDKAVAFIKEHKHHPFFLYVAHTMPHVKIGASSQFLDKSKRGLYGDVIEEIDWNVGRILDTVKACGLDEKTYVIFTSDNGPWLIEKEMGGSAAPLRNGKGSSWEGGFRVPCIMRAPGRIPAGTASNELITTLDILPTLARLAGAKVPCDRAIDGKDQSAFIMGKTTKSARDTFYYYVRDELHAVRQGKWKLALPEREMFYYYATDEIPVESPQLYDLETDISEQHDLADKYPEIVKKLLKLADQAREDVGDLDKLGKNARSPMYETVQENK